MKTIKDTNYSFEHTKLRMKERYAMSITRDEYDLLCKKVRTKNDVRLIKEEKQDGDIQYVYDLQFTYKGKIRVVWSKERNCITTVLPVN